MPHVDEGTLHAYLDGELPSAERKTLETHFAECASCRTQLAEERALLERASALLGATRPVERPVPPFEQLRPRAPKRSPWRVRTPVAWAASIALALGLGYYLHEPVAHPAAAIPEQAEEPKTAPTTPTPSRPARNLAPAPAPTVATIPPARRDSAAAAATVAGAMERARVDSDVALNREVGKAAAGVLVIPPPAAQAMTRDSAPTLNEAILTSSAAARGGRSALPSTTSWPIISRGAARSLLGTEPVGLPGLARKIRRSPANDGTVLVEQKIDSATTIQIFQQQNATAAFSYDTDLLGMWGDCAWRSPARSRAIRSTSCSIRCSRYPSPPRRHPISSATTLTAISSGVTAPIARPTGTRTRSRLSAGTPAAVNPFVTTAFLRLLPNRPT